MLSKLTLKFRVWYLRYKRAMLAGRLTELRKIRRALMIDATEAIRDLNEQETFLSNRITQLHIREISLGGEKVNA